MSGRFRHSTHFRGLIAMEGKKYVLLFNWAEMWLFQGHRPYAEAFFKVLSELLYLPDPSEESFVWSSQLRIDECCPYAKASLLNKFVILLTGMHSDARSALSLPPCNAITSSVKFIGDGVAIYVTDHFHDQRVSP